MSRRSEALAEALEEAALAGAKEIKEFLGTYRGKDPERLKRVQVAVGAVSGYTRWRASQNNMVSMMLMAARQTGVSGRHSAANPIDGRRLGRGRQSRVGIKRPRVLGNGVTMPLRLNAKLHGV